MEGEKERTRAADWRNEENKENRIDSLKERKRYNKWEREWKALERETANSVQGRETLGTDTERESTGNPSAGAAEREAAC